MKVDFKKELAEFYAPKTGDFTLVTVPSMQYLMVDGHGDPNTAPMYVEAIEALYSVSYTLKFHSKKVIGRDYVVPPLEGLWWAEDLNAFRTRAKADWDWTMMVMVPEWLGADDVAAAIETVRTKKPQIHVERVRLERYDEGLCAQILHVGSYDDETPTLLRLHDEWLPQNGLRERLKHHEIYLGDPRKSDPSKLKTVIRQPVERR